MEKIMIGIIGGGRIGRMHAGTIYTGMQDVTIKYVSDIYPQAAQQWGPMYGVQNVVSDAEIVFNDPEAQAVLIRTSTDTHADYIIRAAECGKDIYCEKPIDLSVEKIERALAAVEKAGVRLQIGFNRRFDRNFRRAYEAIQAGEIGKPLMIRITNRDATPPPEAYIKVSGGMLLDMSIHDFDLCRYFAGSEAESVYCTGACNLVPYIGANGDVDTAVTVINFKNGCTAVVDNSRQTGHGMECRVEIMGTEGNLVTGNEVENTLTICEDNGLKQDGLACDFFARFKNSFPVILARSLIPSATTPQPSPPAAMAWKPCWTRPQSWDRNTGDHDGRIFLRASSGSRQAAQRRGRPARIPARHREPRPEAGDAQLQRQPAFPG